MVHPYQVPALIAGQLPASSIYQSIQTLTDYTKRMALEHNFKEVQQCMNIVEKLYAQGNTLVKNAVENIFIFSFSTMMARCSSVEWRIVQSYMPADLYNCYVRQVLQSKC